MLTPTFNEHYFTPFGRSVTYALPLAFACSYLLGGAHIVPFLSALAVYAVLLLIVATRLPTQPTRSSLRLVTWGLPVLYLAALGIQLAWQHLRPIA